MQVHGDVLRLESVSQLLYEVFGRFRPGRKFNIPDRSAAMSNAKVDIVYVVKEIALKREVNAKVNMNSKHALHFPACKTPARAL